MAGRDDRLREELQFHLEQQIAKNIKSGMTPEDARRDALVKFGGLEPAREAARDQLRWTWVADLWRDMRVSGRALVRVPSFAISTILTMALGIGAAAAMFSVFDGVLLRPMPFPDADRIVHLYQLGETGARNRVSDPNYQDWRTGTTTFKAMAQYSQWGQLPVIGAGDAQLVRVTYVSREYFDIMGVRPWLGRTFFDEEQQPGAAPVVVVSAAFWRRWKGDQPPSGETLSSGSTAFTVIGVMPDGFDYPGQTAIWAPREISPPSPSRTSHNALAIARLADHATLEQAQAEISALSRRLKEEHGDRTWMFDAAAVPVLEVVTSTSKATLQLLLAASVLLLVVACTNVSNLLLARAASRRAEFAVQLAMGATAGRIGRQLLAETLVVCLTGAALGVLVASSAVKLFVAFAPATVQRLDGVSVSWPAVAFAIAVSVTAALILSAITAAGVRGTRIADAMADHTRSGTQGRGQLRVREALIVTQVAITLVLLAAAALLGRSLMAAMAIDPGYSIDDGLVVGLTSAADGSETTMARQVTFQDNVLAQLGRQPGIDHVGLVSRFPIGASSAPNGSFIEMTRPDEITSFADMDFQDPELKQRVGSAEYRHVSGEYFEAMGIPLLEGRLIDDRDGPNAPQVAVVSQSLADTQWPGRSALGRWIQFGNMDGDLRPIRVVGVVGDVREVSPESRPAPSLYVSARQRPRQASRAWVVMRGPAATSLAETARRIVRQIDPEVPATTTTVSAALGEAFGGRRFTLWLVGAFGVSALVLATLGVYGLFAYAVSRRMREMGIRLALGAEPQWLVWLIVKRGAVLTTLGALAGVVIAYAGADVVAGMLFGVEPGDPATVAAAVVTITLASILASYAPARRILKQSPARTLRDV
jgi:predicted permease